jgi:hypothetical protein
MRAVLPAGIDCVPAAQAVPAPTGRHGRLGAVVGLAVGVYTKRWQRPRAPQQAWPKPRARTLSDRRTHAHIRKNAVQCARRDSNSQPSDP